MDRLSVCLLLVTAQVPLFATAGLSSQAQYLPGLFGLALVHCLAQAQRGGCLVHFVVVELAPRHLVIERMSVRHPEQKAPSLVVVRDPADSTSAQRRVPVDQCLEKVTRGGRQAMASPLPATTSLGFSSSQEGGVDENEAMNLTMKPQSQSQQVLQHLFNR